MIHRVPERALLAWVCLCACALLTGCTEEAGSSTPKAEPGARRERAHLVELATVSRGALSVSRVHTGSLRARRVVRIHVQEEGRIVSLPFFEGDRVAQGTVVLRLDPTLLETGIAKARAVRREAEANLERVVRLSKSRMVAEEEVLRARTSVDVARADEALLGTRLGYTEVSAPFAGVVTERRAEPGDVVERHDHVLTVADPTSLVADLQVSELLLPHLSVGHPARVRIDALGDGTFPGRVMRIHPQLDPATRNGRVEVALDPPPAAARAGQFARVTFEVRALDRQIIPFSALRRDTEGEYVLRMRDDATVERVRVRGGRRLAERVEVLEGLTDGDRVVTKGFLGLTPGTRVKPVGGAPAGGGKTGIGAGEKPAAEARE